MKDEERIFDGPLIPALGLTMIGIVLYGAALSMLVNYVGGF